MSIPSSFNVFLRDVPNWSLPTTPINDVFLPKLFNIASTLQGAPPAFASKTGLPCALKPFSVKSIKSKNTRATTRSRQSAVNWAKGKLGKSYAYTVNNKSCGNNDYNCSQLVWCSYKETTEGRDLDSDGTWFVSPSDIKNSDWTYNVWTY